VKMWGGMVFGHWERQKGTGIDVQIFFVSVIQRVYVFCVDLRVGVLAGTMLISRPVKEFPKFH
jgi:hypothetical protein